MTLVFYHRTTRDAATKIMATGFKSAVGTYGIGREVKGVWLSNIPLDENEGARGDLLLRVVLAIEEAEIADYEWIEELKTYREWLIPASVVNGAMVETRIVDDRTDS